MRLSTLELDISCAGRKAKAMIPMGDPIANVMWLAAVEEMPIESG
jgi:hypothetical protein